MHRFKASTRAACEDVFATPAGAELVSSASTSCCRAAQVCMSITTLHLASQSCRRSASEPHTLLGSGYALLSMNPQWAVQGPNDVLMGALRKWVQDEYKDKLGQEVDTSSWPIRCACASLLCMAHCAHHAGSKLPEAVLLYSTGARVLQHKAAGMHRSASPGVGAGLDQPALFLHPHQRCASAGIRLCPSRATGTTAACSRCPSLTQPPGRPSSP